MIIYDVTQNSDEWDVLRSIIPTASAGNQIITSKGIESKSLDKYAETLANNLYAGKPVDAWEGNKFTERGHEVEDTAFSWYEFKFECELERIGFVTDDNETYGASPDARVNAKKLVEIKCLPKAHTEVLRFYHKYKKVPAKFFVQPQFQMLAAESELVDLLFYHDLLPKLIIPIERNEEFIDKLKVQIKKTNSLRDEIYNILKEF